VFLCYVIAVVIFIGSMIVDELWRYVSNSGTGTNSGELHVMCCEDFALVNNFGKYLVQACAVHTIEGGGTQHP
jgi:hypothetical protein